MCAVGTSLVIQWLRLHASTAVAMGSIPGQGTKIPRAVQCGQKVLVAQLCLTLCDPMDCILPGSSVHGILQVRILEWVAISFSQKIKNKHVLFSVTKLWYSPQRENSCSTNPREAILSFLWNLDLELGTNLSIPV